MFTYFYDAVMDRFMHIILARGSNYYYFSMTFCWPPRFPPYSIDVEK